MGKSFISFIGFIASLIALLHFFFGIDSFNEFLFECNRGNLPKFLLFVFIATLVLTITHLIFDTNYERIEAGENFFEKNAKAIEDTFIRCLFFGFLIFGLIMYYNVSKGRPLFFWD